MKHKLTIVTTFTIIIFLFGTFYGNAILAMIKGSYNMVAYAATHVNANSRAGSIRSNSNSHAKVNNGINVNTGDTVRTVVVNAGGGNNRNNNNRNNNNRNKGNNNNNNKGGNNNNRDKNVRVRRETNRDVRVVRRINKDVKVVRREDTSIVVKPPVFVGNPTETNVNQNVEQNVEQVVENNNNPVFVGNPTETIIERVVENNNNNENINENNVVVNPVIENNVGTVDTVREVVYETAGGYPVYVAPAKVYRTPETGAGSLSLLGLLPAGLIGSILRRRFMV